MRLTVFIVGLALIAAVFASATITFAQDGHSHDTYDYAEDLIPTVTAEIDESARLVLDYEPQLPDAASTRPTLAEILARPEFQGESVEETRGEGLLERFINWLSVQLSKLGMGGSITTMGKLLIALFIGLLLFLLVRLVWEILGGRRFSNDPKQTANLENLTAVDLVGLATKAAAKGDYQLAIRLRFKAVIGVLKMPSSAVLTNTQVLRRLKRNMPFAAAPFGELATIFEDTWYGQQPSTAANYKLVSECAGKIEHELGGLEE